MTKTVYFSSSHVAWALYRTRGQDVGIAEPPAAVIIFLGKPKAFHIENDLQIYSGLVLP